MKTLSTARVLVLAGVLCLVIGLALVSREMAQAQETTVTPSFHPPIALLDANGQNVRLSGAPASTMRSCGTCHDTAFIAEHSGHANSDPSVWNAVSYATTDATDRADWLAAYSLRHVGGGPAAPDIEMNCFLCHTAAPNSGARIEALAARDFAWVNSATLLGTGILDKADGEWGWMGEAFNADGTVRPDFIRIQDPASETCGQCHGLAQTDAQATFNLTPGDSAYWNTLTSGQVFASQRLVNSGLNLRDKPELGRSFDIHAERVVGCTDCHYAVNNPVYFSEATGTRPDHLTFDPRRLDFGDYLYRPLHEFANSSTGIDDFGATRPCAGCHNAPATHSWLPYAERHFATLACESCHVPALYGPALESVDWTALRADGTPIMRYRGVTGEDGDVILTGFVPTLLPRQSADGETRMSPFNLVTVSHWVSGEAAQPVPVAALRSAWLVGDGYHPDVLAAFDADGDGSLSDAELRLDSDAKIALISGRLAAQGLDNPRIAATVEPYAVHHGVAEGVWATRECRTCHGEESRLNAPVILAGFTPGGAQPSLTDGAQSNGTVTRGEDGRLVYRADTSAPPVNLYVLGHDSVVWIDAFGMIAFLGVFAGVVVHGGLRYLSARRMKTHLPATAQKVYMYSVYERQWHWLQTVAIFGLLFTGLVIHRPTFFSMFAFDWVVTVHNALAIVLVINAALSAFYHLVSGEIRQFLPRPYGFFDQAFAQAKYYLSGIFKGEAHPFDKTPERKLNPLQQVVYLAILNVLLPLQIITGALMWGVQRLPQVTEQLGGLPFLAPFHTLIAWLFATFIVLHVYLTTTGHTPLANIQAMMLGWDEIEAGAQPTTGQPARGEGVGS